MNNVSINAIVKLCCNLVSTSIDFYDVSISARRKDNIIIE